MTLDSLTPNEGIGSALLEAVKTAATEQGCKRLWLITTNDNVRALRFYQKRGFHIAAIHVDALNESRRLKPQIPIIGCGGVTTGTDIAEYLIAGAQAVAAGTIHLAEPRAGRRLLDELISWMRKNRVSSVASLINTMG